VRVCWAVAILMCASGVAVAQQKPEDVVRAFFKAEDQGRWSDAARMLDLPAVERIRAVTVYGLQHMKDYPPPSVESLMRMEPDLPRAVAEYRVKEMQQEMSSYDILAQDFARVTSVDTLASMTLEEAAARWLEAKGPEWRTELQFRNPRARPRNDCARLSDSAMKALQIKEARGPRAVVLGATPDTGSVSYVVVSVAFPGAEQVDSLRRAGPLPRAIELRKLAGVWKIEPASDLPSSNGLGGSYVYSVACGEGSLIGDPKTK